jgi:S-adenosyl-L-methionine hydrolase (adenosine-forming)
MIVLFTDFGHDGPYVGQMKTVLHAAAPDRAVVDLMHDAPRFRPREAAYLLAALIDRLPGGAILIGVVDPGVGGPREAVILEADGRWLVGPDNGLFALALRRAAACRAWRITWRPQHLSASFHGRDLFAPVAAGLARGQPPARRRWPAARLDRADWPDDLAAVIYLDGFGNAMTGLRAAGVAQTAGIAIAGHHLPHARVFAARPPGAAFWYENSCGLVEIAVNQGSAAAALGLAIGTPLSLHDPGSPEGAPEA